MPTATVSYATVICVEALVRVVGIVGYSASYTALILATLLKITMAEGEPSTPKKRRQKRGELSKSEKSPPRKQRFRKEWLEVSKATWKRLKCIFFSF